MALHFASASYWAKYGLNSYAEWLVDTEVEGLYRTHKRALQQLQWKGPSGRWTLREPIHQLNLTQLAATYPDARFVQTHRDPARTIPSAASFVWTIQRLLTPGMDRVDTGRAAARLFGSALERSTRAREDPALDARVIDVAYRDTVTDPVGTVQRCTTPTPSGSTAKCSGETSARIASGSGRCSASHDSLRPHRLPAMHHGQVRSVQASKRFRLNFERSF